MTDRSGLSRATLSNSEISRVEPVNFQGLWSTSLVGHEKRWWSRPVGGAVVSLLLLSWVGGLLSPMVVIVSMYLEHYEVAAGVSMALLYPYVLPQPNKPWAAAMRFWMLGAHYFDEGCSMSFEKREPNDLSVPQMTCYHPHGVFAFGMIFNSGFRFRGADTLARWAKYCGEVVGPYPHVGLISSALCRAPIFSHVVGRWSCSTETASKASMMKKVKDQESFGIVAGGFNEASPFARNQERVYLRKRKGFIKYALQYGYKVCPAYTFGESNTYWNLCWMPLAVKEPLSRLGVPTVAPFGRWCFLLLPHADKGIHTESWGWPAVPQDSKPYIGAN